MNAARGGDALTPQDAVLRAANAVTEAARVAGLGGAPVDVAAVLAEIVAGVAANLGSLDRLLVGRSGSWEADLVGQIVVAGLGDDPITWRARRPLALLRRLSPSLAGGRFLDRQVLAKGRFRRLQSGQLTAESVRSRHCSSRWIPLTQA